MPDQTSAETPRRRRSLIVLLLAALCLGTASMSLAQFTDSDTSSGSFTTGTLDIATSPSTLFTVTAMVPGDTVNATLTISNGGTIQLRYAMTSSSTNTDTKALRDQLTLTIKTVGTSCALFDGTQLYSGAVSGAAFGSTSQGQQAGDRSLDAATSELLCFRVNLPLASGNGFQGATTSTTFTFSAEQTANNP
jgi:spore coat-associated protein N